MAVKPDGRDHSRAQDYKPPRDRFIHRIDAESINLFQQWKLRSYAFFENSIGLNV
jgi:hypothetical protein